MPSQLPSPPRQRVTPFRAVRQPIRDELFRFVRKVFDTDDGRSLLTEALGGLLASAPPFVPQDEMKTHCVYPELGEPGVTGQASLTPGPIIISGRFRSGSTLLWNIFRQVDGCTAYYEPFNERRWFDRARRGSHTDATHLGVSDYWREYEGLEDLADCYQEHWIDRDLYMDASAWDPAMKQYVSALVGAARGRAVLQFNRIDFRLPWFRAHFRDATIVHLYRNPRDQWCSSLVDPGSFSKDAPLSSFGAHDHFYLSTWVRDLRRRFRFLDESRVSHPYQLFYYLWKLSYLFGAHYAHYSLAFEHLVRNPERELRALMRAVDVREYDLARLITCVADQRLGKWRDYADDAWFARHESACEDVLHEYFGSARASELDQAARVGQPEPLDQVLQRI